MDNQQAVIVSLLQDGPLRDPARLDSLAEAEWRQVIASAEAEGLAPVLWSRVQALGLRIPESTRLRLRELLLNNTARNLQIIKSFDALASALQGGGIDFIPLKGVYLCSNLYENLGERSIWDIDLLVAPPSLSAALAAIASTGYKPSRPYDLEAEIRSFHHVPAYVKPGAPPLEMHWTLLNPRFNQKSDWQDLWRRSIPSRIGASSVRVLCAEDQLIYLCAHVAYQHMYIESLRSIYDIKLTLKAFGQGIDWAAVSQRAQMRGLLNSLYLSLYITNALLGPVMDDSSLARLRPPGFRQELADAAVSRLFEAADISPVINAVWSRRSLPMRLRGMWDRLAVPPSILAGRYGLPPRSWRVYLYYPVRLWDLLRAHGSSLLGLLFGGRWIRERALRDSELVTYLGWWN